MENAKKMFLFNVLLTAVIAFTSLYLIKKVNKIVTIEKFAYGSGSSASYAPLMKVDKEDFEDEKETTKKVDADNTDSTDNTVKKDSCKPCPINNTNRNEQILKGFGNQDVDTLFGTPTHYSEASASYSNKQEMHQMLKEPKRVYFYLNIMIANQNAVNQVLVKVLDIHVILVVYVMIKNKII